MSKRGFLSDAACSVITSQTTGSEIDHITHEVIGVESLDHVVHLVRQRARFGGSALSGGRQCAKRGSGGGEG